MDHSELATLNKDTKVKYLSNRSQGSLTIDNSWGSLAKLLKQVLSLGFNENVISGLALDKTYNIFTVTFNFAHSYSLNSVIAISGVSNLVDGEYRILDFSDTTIKIASNPLKTYVEPFVITANSKIKMAPLGYDVLFDEVNTSGKIVFKNKSTKSPAILKVIDALPPNGYLNTWAKFARVVVGQNIVNINEFLNNEKAPFLSTLPNVENVGNGVSGASGIHGYSKWFYSSIKSSAMSETGIVTEDIFPINWRIIGDDKTFYLFLRPMGSYSWYTIYSFGNYISNFKEDTQNIILHASFNLLKASDGTLSSSYGSINNKFTQNNIEGACCLFKNSYRGLENDFLGYHFGLDPGDSAAVYRDYPSNSQTLAPVSSNTGSKLTSPIFIKDKYYEYRGYLRGISQLYGQPYKSLDGQLLDGSDIILSAQRYYNSSDNQPQVPYLFSFKDWVED